MITINKLQNKTIPANNANPKYNAPIIKRAIHPAAYFLVCGIRIPITPNNSNIPVPILPRGSCQSLVNNATDSGRPRNLNGSVCKRITETIIIAICSKVMKLRIFTIIDSLKLVSNHFDNHFINQVLISLELTWDQINTIIQ